MVDRSTAPLEMFGEPDDTECPHGIPTGMGVECWECRYDQLKIDYDALEQECGELAERVQELAAEIAEPSIKELDTLHRIRKAVGDTGKMMQDELVDKIQEIVSENATLRKRLDESNRNDFLSQALNEGDGVYRYILTEQPEVIKRPRNALSILLGEIKDKYDDVICAEDLRKILIENNFIISRKGGTYKSA